jgi:NAD(P)-dependent dehydrogenase (short-subunit alcohol dehydrogenase family)
MNEPRSVVVTGASRGLGLATAKRLYQRGWRVVGAMRSPQQGLERMREVTGAPEGDSRLLAVRLDLVDEDSIKAAGEAIRDAVGAPHAVVHNAGVSALGFAEETPAEAWKQVFGTNVFGPVALTNELLPAMRAAGRGRILTVSSQGGMWGMPSAAAYSAAKAASDRWAEALAGEIAPFGLGVTVLVAGVFDTDIINDRAPDYPDYRDWDGDFALQHKPLDDRGHKALRIAKDPDVFARAVVKALDGDRAPFARHGVGFEAKMIMVCSRILPGRGLHQIVRLVLGQPRRGALAGKVKSAPNPAT